MQVNAWASLPHYAHHLRPILAALPDEHRGAVWGPAHARWADRHGDTRSLPDGPLIVAGLVDAQRWPDRPLIYLEHGAGQTYRADPRGAASGSYSGGPGLDHVRLFLTPHATVADRWAAAYPAARVAVVGCPFLDPWHPPAPPAGPARTVAVTFHWDCGLTPETRWAQPHYRSALRGLHAAVRAAGGDLLGHGHPRAWRALRPLWERIGVEPVERWRDVLDRADVLVGDNTSALPEFASTGRPVVWLNAPWYRRDVHHGGRFWDWPEEQPTVDEPADLTPTVLAVLADPTIGADARARMTAGIYDHTAGDAAARAARAVLSAL